MTKYHVATVVQEIEVPAGKTGTRTKKLKEEILVGGSATVSVVEEKINEINGEMIINNIKYKIINAELMSSRINLTSG